MWNYDDSDRERDEDDPPELISHECALHGHDECWLKDCICECHDEGV